LESTLKRHTGRNSKLHELTMNLERKGINGIWARFIENFFAPVLAEPFE